MSRYGLFGRNISFRNLILVLMLASLSACGGGGSDPAPAPTGSPIGGGGVKGPFAFSIVTVYAYDPSQLGFKGAVIATATTDGSGAIVGLTLPYPAFSASTTLYSRIYQ